MPKNKENTIEKAKNIENTKEHIVALIKKENQ